MMLKLTIAVFLALLAVTVTAAASYNPTLNFLPFDAWLAQQQQSAEAPIHKLHTAFDVELRRQIYNTNMESIRKHNAKYEAGAATYWQGPNAFTHLTDDEFLGYYTGLNKLEMRLTQQETGPTQSAWKKTPQALLQHAGVGATLPRGLNPIDWSAATDPLVNSQGKCGSCWAHAAANTVVGRLNAQHKTSYPPLSRQQLVSCAPNDRHCGGVGGCHGSTAQLAWNYIKLNGGITTDEVYPYTSGTTQEDGKCLDQRADVVAKKKYFVESWQDVTPNNATAFYEALKTGPIAINVDATHWKAYAGGVLSGDVCKAVDVNHVVTAVGVGFSPDTGLHFMKIMNSWGREYGMGGYIYVKIANPETETEMCGIDTKPASGTQCTADDPDTWKTLACGCSAVYYEPTISNTKVLY